MKPYISRHVAVALAVSAGGLLLAACDDFLDRPNEDSYNTSNFYTSDESLYGTVAIMYNSPWYDFQRGFFKTGEVFAGNYYWGSSPYLTFVVQSTDEDLNNMSASLWAVIAQANIYLSNVKLASGCSESAINSTQGEALTLKALAYFYLVRSFGGVPIVDDNMAMLDNYNGVPRATPDCVYRYIIKTLERALTLLPASNAAGRIDYYCAEGLLSKVYLFYAGLNPDSPDGFGGSISSDHAKQCLQKAVELAKDVKDNSGRELMPKYDDIFRLANNMCSESLIAWRWTAAGTNWTRQNTFQSDLGVSGFDETGAVWGGWAGPSVDLIENVFEDSPLKAERNNTDARRHATCMMAGDTYEYFWTDRAASFDKGAFEILDFYYQKDEAKLEARGGYSGGGTFQSATGAQEVKHLVGDNADHIAGIGYAMDRMATSLATHLLRLADVYLILAEAQCLKDGGSTSDAAACEAFNKVHNRSATWKEETSLTIDQIRLERRKELALEGDSWYDYLRRAYYDLDGTIAALRAQKRGCYYGLDDAYKAFFEAGYQGLDCSKCGYDDKATNLNKVTLDKTTLYLPFPDTDLATNPLLREEPQKVDIDQYF